ncbi:lytic murein transglycosylase [Rhodobacter sp. KR11]|uniref:lytic murein transglycosylase n=1 Tax=Rhodobacter sp. KR11 TaxID=2974588 RepID=UPI0022213661|nr:lytic murein transglycosylase [Rhodobacter sp. KR11]MCW1918775.1 lytic murein transglycosylase [Rhodobacter sp. KR11]
MFARISRRGVLAGLMAAPMAAFADQFAPVADAGWEDWAARFQGRALDQGISQATLRAAFSRAGFVPGVIEKDRNQAESIWGMEDYLAITANDERVTAGRKALRRNRGLLRKLEQAYGVDAHVLTAIWGVESYYGTKKGTVPVISALSTLAYEGRRGEFFEGQLIAALKILQHGDTTADRMLGGWAGAMGHMQFIPTTYRAYAVDATGDGRSDHWGEDPADALASAAHYLAESGWQLGQPWGVEVQVPPGTKEATRTVAEWAERGVTPVTRIAGAAKAKLVTSSGPGFFLLRNGRVLGAYNASTRYIVGVGVLSDRVNGGGGLRGTFPPDGTGLTQAERVRVQTRLTALGFDTGSTDGVFGRKTKAALQAWQAATGQPVTGQASPEVLRALR